MELPATPGSSVSVALCAESVQGPSKSHKVSPSCGLTRSSDQRKPQLQVWSLGVMLYELCPQASFQGLGPRAVAQARGVQNTKFTKCLSCLLRLASFKRPFEGRSTALVTTP